jgi:phosphatidate phosphatase APP1
MVVVLLASTSWADAAVLLFPAVGTPGQVTLAGRVLKHAPSGGSSTFSKNLRRLTSSNWEGAKVEVRYADRSVEVVSGHDGNFSVTLSGARQPFEVGITTAEAHVKGAEAGIAMVDIVSPAAGFFVVSDFDDTLAVTNVVDGTKLVRAALLQDETTQPVVDGMAEFYGCLKNDKPARPGFALVSGSPAQYLGRVRQFLGSHGFPVFGIYLRDLGPNTLSNYKQPVIRNLLKEVPNQVVLIGDSGEHDPEVYAQMRTEFPERVKAIYIRDAGRAEDAKRFTGMFLFKEPKEAAHDAVLKGLASAECVERAFPSATAVLK